MPIIKNFKAIVKSMLERLRKSRPNVDTSVGTFTRDVVIDSPAHELEALYIDLNRTSKAQSPDLAVATDLEQLGRNYQLRRKGPVKATGTVTFYSIDAPSSTITISQGTTLAAKALPDGSAPQYTTIQTVTLSASDFNPDTGRYEVDCQVRAVVAGTDANVGPGAISGILNPIAGVAGVYNFNAITSGSDFEALSTYRQRIKSALVGNNVGTLSGYYQTVIRNSNVLDAKVAAVGSGVEALRRGDVGAVDIYVRGLVSTQAPTETYVVPSSTPYEYVTSKQPIDILASAGFTLVGSITGTLTEGTHYSIVKGESKFAGSIRGQDKFVFKSGKVTPGESISITYSYNSLIESLQSYMEGDTRKVLGADLLVKSAKPRQIDIECTIRLLSGYNSSSVISAVETTLSNSLNSYTIGEEVQQSDILAVIANTTGVDDVTVPLDTFEESATTGTLTQNASGNIIIPADSYAVAGNIVVNVRT